jgi:hypothetical protein
MTLRKCGAMHLRSYIGAMITKQCVRDEFRKLSDALTTSQQSAINADPEARMVDRPCSLRGLRRRPRTRNWLFSSCS